MIPFTYIDTNETALTPGIVVVGYGRHTILYESNGFGNDGAKMYYRFDELGDAYAWMADVLNIMGNQEGLARFARMHGGFVSDQWLYIVTESISDMKKKWTEDGHEGENNNMVPLDIWAWYEDKTGGGRPARKQRVGS